MKHARAALWMVWCGAAAAGCPKGSNTPPEQGSSSSGMTSTTSDGGVVGASSSSSGTVAGSSSGGPSSSAQASSWVAASSSVSGTSTVETSSSSSTVTGTSSNAGSSGASSGSTIVGSTSVGASSTAGGPSSGGGMDAGPPRVPCAPEACPPGSACVGPTDDTAFCYLGCARGMNQDCPANEICTGLSGLDAGYCRPAAAQGQSCEMLPCLGGLRCVRYSGLPPTCYAACQPGVPLECPGMDRCLGLSGQDAGFCAPPSAPDGGVAGDPCVPEACQAGFVCVGPTDDSAFCYAQCQPGETPGVCHAAQLCAPLPGVDGGYCSAAALLGQACNPPACGGGLVCVTVEPTAPLCYEACHLDAGSCALDGATCRPLQGVTLGYCSP